MARPREKLETGLYHYSDAPNMERYHVYVAPENTFQARHRLKDYNRVEVIRLPRTWHAPVQRLLQNATFLKATHGLGPARPPHLLGSLVFETKRNEKGMPSGMKSAALTNNFPKYGFQIIREPGPRAMGSWLLRKIVPHLETLGFRHIRFQPEEELEEPGENQLKNAGLKPNVWYTTRQLIDGMDRAIEKSMGKQPA